MAASTMTSKKSAHQSKSRDSGVSDEIMELVEAVKAGKLDRRAHAEKFDGQDRVMLEGINELVDAFMAPINVTAEYVDRISKGDIPPTITDEYKGDFNEIKNNLNGLIQALKGLIDGAATMANAAAAGELDTRVDASGFAGAWQTIVQGLNDTVEGVAVPFKDIGRVTDLIAAGDCSAKVTDDYKGEYNKSKVAINSLGEQLQGVQKVLDDLQAAILAGKLDSRGDASQFKGDIAGMVDGLNGVIEAFVAPINETAKVMEAAANKDLTAQIRSDYKGDFGDLKNNINTAMGALDNALSQVAGATGQVTGASGQIAAGSQTLAEGASEQASSLEEVTASIEEMTAMTQQNSSNAVEANNIAGQARTAVDKGTEAMGRMSAAVDGIQKSSNETAKILKTIDEIAFQTNMLALNAAVEAARAGDAGKGFAVVAEEVRNLAQRSADAAKSTANMIDESVRNAKGGVEISKEVAGALEEIGEGIRKVGDLVGGIATASKEQSQGIEQINVAVGQMDQVTQSAAANAEQSASAAEELSAQAQELQAMTSSFKISSETTGAVSSSNRPRSAAPRAKASSPTATTRPKGKRTSKGTQPQNGNGKQAQPVAALSGGSSEEFMALDDKNLSEF